MRIAVPLDGDFLFWTMKLGLFSLSAGDGR